MKPLYEGYERIPDEYKPAVYERIMAAYPERLRWHPVCIGACLQMEGWSDQDIVDNFWLDKEVEAEPTKTETTKINWKSWCNQNGTFVGINSRLKQIVGPNPQAMRREKFLGENGLDLKPRQGDSDAVLGPFELDILKSAGGWRPKDATEEARLHGEAFLLARQAREKLLCEGWSAWRRQ